MSLNWPIPSFVGEQYTYAGSTWEWNGSAWQSLGPGQAGPTGPTGASGSSGSSGANGVTGPTGPTGASGSSGSVGATGPTGVTGAVGSSLASGTITLTGATGFFFNTALSDGSGSSITVLSANVLYAYPFVAGKNYTITSLYASLSSGGSLSSGQEGSIVLYSDNNGSPGTKLRETVGFNIGIGYNTTAVGASITDYALTAGTIYWLAFYVNNITGGINFKGSSSVPVVSVKSLVGDDFGPLEPIGYSQAATFGSAPSTWSSTTLIRGSLAPVIALGYNATS